MFIVGENPVATLPPQAKVEESLDGLEFLVCQELFLTETAKRAHVVLPACSYAEKDGTFTNTEGHVQSVRRAMEPIGESRPDWEVFSALSLLMGNPIEYGEAKEIFKEIRSAISGYGLLGPSATPPRIKDEVVDRYLQEGFKTDVEFRYAFEEENTQPDEMLTLASVQSLFHSGKFSTRAKGLLQIQASGFLNVNPVVATRLGLADGPIEYGEAKEIFKEIRSAISGYGLLGPSATPPRIKDEVVDRYLQEGFKTDVEFRYAFEEENTQPDEMLTLASVQSLFHSGKFSTRAKGLLQIHPNSPPPWPCSLSGKTPWQRCPLRPRWRRVWMDWSSSCVRNCF